MGRTRFSGLVVGEQITGDGTVSSTPVNLIQRYIVQFTEPAVSSGPSHAQSTFTVTGATTSASYVFNPSQPLTTGYSIASVRCSTANELAIVFAGNSASSLSGSTNRGTLLQFDYNSTGV